MMTFLGIQRYHGQQTIIMNKHNTPRLFPGVDQKPFFYNNYCIKALLISVLLLSQFSFRTNVRDHTSHHQKRETNELVVPASIMKTESQGTNAKRLNFDRPGILFKSSTETQSKEKIKEYNKRSCEMYRIML
jgi:hypothetical protein